ncbi:MAG TPA: GDSL-type esterase/lipase family protein [Burkholderiaceae bacterium]|jgi:lysophospholipase L1-like esterase|nr:GDSL-type esterase/lipase family protein [Burkholderiaceae bacterium]
MNSLHLHVSFSYSPRRFFALLGVVIFLVTAFAMTAASAQGRRVWITSWAASPQGPYPSGAAVAQPDLSFAFPTSSANDQTFRLIVRPDLWSSQMRVRFTNLVGNQAITFDGIFVGLQKTGATIEGGTTQPITFGGNGSLTLQPGQTEWSDPVSLPFVNDSDQGRSYLLGRKLAISFHTVGQSGPMTWHAKAMTTSYVTAPGAGSVGQIEDDAAFPTSTTSWYFIDALDMMAPEGTQLVVALGDSITDGTSSTINGDDRWPNVLARRLHAAYGDRVVVVNEGIGGNQIVGPAVYDPTHPVAGGPSAVERLSRDVLGLSGVTALIWHEGTNDVSAGTGAAAIEAGVQEVVQKLRASIPGIRLVGTTITSEVGAAGNGGTPAAAAERILLNSFIKSSGLFDTVVDFYAVTTDPQTGALKAQYVPNTSIGGPGDHVHPNRAGYLAMGTAVPINALVHSSD